MGKNYEPGDGLYHAAEHIDRKIDNMVDSDGLFSWGNLIRFLAWVGGVIVLLMILNFGLGWIGKALQKGSADNVEDSYTQFYDAYAGLQAEARNINSYRGQLNQLYIANGPDVPKWGVLDRDRYNQLSTQLTSWESAFGTHCEQYKIDFKNEFKSIVAPPDLPRDCPVLEPLHVPGTGG